jgi:hypothetical protein
MPRYETLQDVCREAMVAGWLGQFLGAVPVKTGAFSPHDYLLQKDGKTSHAIEIKCRSGVRKYKDYMVSAEKWHNLIAAGLEHKCPALLVLYDETDSRIYAVKAASANVSHLSIIGRNDRPEQPPEPSVVIEWGKFKSIAIIKRKVSNVG